MTDNEVASTAHLLANLAVTSTYTPIHFLPDDIIYCVFLVCVQDAPRHFPTTASHVCRSWRSLALGAATLWTSLVFDRNRRTIEKNTAWVARSGAALLDMEMKNEAFEKASIKTTSHVIRIIKAQSHRVRTLSLGDDVAPKVFRLFFDELRYVLLPQLLEIRMESQHWFRRFRWRPQLMETGAPNLQRLSLKYNYFNWSSPLLKNLRALRITMAYNFSPNDSLSILHGAPHLQSLIIRMYDDLEPEWKRIDFGTRARVVLGDHFSMAHLDVPDRIFSYLISRFRFPALTHLRFGNYRPWDPPPGPSPPLNNILPQLEHLTLYVQNTLDPQDLVIKLNDILSSYSTMETLTTVELDGMWFTDNDRSVHTLGGFGPNFPPNLHTVLLDDCMIGDTLGPMKELVASRVNVAGVTPIRRLSLTVSWKPTLKAFQQDADLEWLVSNVHDFYVGLYDFAAEAQPYWGSF